MGDPTDRSLVPSDADAAALIVSLGGCTEQTEAAARLVVLRRRASHAEAAASLVVLSRPRYDRLVAVGREFWGRGVRYTPGLLQGGVLLTPWGTKVRLEDDDCSCAVLDLQHEIDWTEYDGLRSTKPRVLRFLGQSIVAVSLGARSLSPKIVVCAPPAKPDKETELRLPDSVSRLVYHGELGPIVPAGHGLSELVLVIPDLQCEACVVFECLERLATSLIETNVVVVADGCAAARVDAALNALTARGIILGRPQSYIDLRSREQHYRFIGEVGWMVEMELGNGSTKNEENSIGRR